jgi:hypothetical protein
LRWRWALTEAAPRSRLLPITLDSTSSESISSAADGTLLPFALVCFQVLSSL